MVEWWGRFSESTFVRLFFDRYIQMSTAIFSCYTTGGFVLAADGRGLDEVTLEVSSDEIQKVFRADGPGRVLGYAITGTAALTSDEGEIVIDIAREAQRAADSLSTRRTKNLEGYAIRFCALIYKALRDAQSSNRISRFSKCPPPNANPLETPETIVTFIMTGYCNGTPAFIRARIFHENGVLREPEIYRERLEETFMSGVPEVARLLFEDSDATFAAYRRPIPKNRPTTISEASEIAEQYVLACSSPEAMALNPGASKAIGGRILIANITRDRGFQWVAGREPAPTSAPA
jgi:hypothetical protein